MEKKIGNLFAEAGNAAKGLIDKSKEKVISIVDQDDDGKITMTDVSVVKDVVGDAMKEIKYFPHGYLNYDIPIMMPEAGIANELIINEMEKFIVEN